MIVSLVGYSGIGKSLLSRRLANELSWQRICCDELIEDRLSLELRDIAGECENRLAAWMGYPWEPLARERQELYLLLEEQVLDEICDALEAVCDRPEQPDIVIDTTGSCIYVADAVLHRLRKYSTIVYLEASENEEEALIESFFAHPKPIVWGDVYQELEGEHHEAAIRRCYLDLLESRRTRYEALASVHLRLDPEIRHRLGAGELLSEIHSASRVRRQELPKHLL